MWIKTKKDLVEIQFATMFYKGKEYALPYELSFPPTTVEICYKTEEEMQDAFRAIAFAIQKGEKIVDLD